VAGLLALLLGLVVLLLRPLACFTPSCAVCGSACATSSLLPPCQPPCTHRPAGTPLLPHALLQLSAVSAELAELIVAPEAHKPPMDLRALTV
jgi:hypothetical protein